jgi:hypothetical protein
MGCARSYYHSRGFRGVVSQTNLQDGHRFYSLGGIIWWLWFPLSRCGIRRTHFLSLIFLNQSIASLGHAGARCFIRRSSVKIGVAKGYVSLALLK